LKPKTLLIPLKGLMTFLAWIASFLWTDPVWIGVAALGTLALFIDAGTFLYGLRFTPNRREALFTLAIAPIYLMVWIRSLALSAVSGTVWHRVRPVNHEIVFSEIGLINSLERLFKIHQKSPSMAIQPVIAESGD
jgi:hypothetical protein